MPIVINPVDVDFEGTRARKLLDHKVRETISKCGVAGLGAVLVTGAGNRIVYATHGIRKIGASGDANRIQSTDRWCLGSVSKPITGTAIGILIQKGIGNLAWTSRLGEVFPEIRALPGAHPAYFDVTLELFMAHASGMPYNPSGEPADQWFPQIAALGLNDANVMERRQKFVHAAVRDAPLFPPGTGREYGGGTIICAAMFERRTGIRFERLVQQHLYDPLGMTNSGFGVTSAGDLDGPWQHGWDEQSDRLVASDVTHDPTADYGSHAVAGSFCMAAYDMGRFIRENLRPDPVAMTLATRQAVQSVLPTTASATTRGAWSCDDPGAPATADIWHNGDNGRMYAMVTIRRAAQSGSAAFSNVNSRFGAPAVDDMQDAMRTIENNWTALCAGGDTPLWECAHPAPALTAVGGTTQWLFARKHTGALARRKLSTVSGADPAIEFPGAVFTSGVAAAASTDGRHIMAAGRGTDNRIWRCWSTDAGVTWKGFEPILTGTFQTGPAMAMSASGGIIHVFAVGMDARMYRTRSIDGGMSWSSWTAVGSGLFTSNPAAACSGDGKIVHAFGRGADFRIWRNLSMHSGASWQTSWSPIGQGIFTTGPAAACQATGATVHVVARGTDRRLWRNVSANSGSGWLPNWQPIPEGTFTSAPGIEISEDAGMVDVVALGGDFCVWKTRSTTGGASWEPWQQVGTDCYL